MQAVAANLDGIAAGLWIGSRTVGEVSKAVGVAGRCHAVRSRYLLERFHNSSRLLRFSLGADRVQLPMMLSVASATKPRRLGFLAAVAVSGGEVLWWPVATRVGRSERKIATGLAL